MQLERWYARPLKQNSINDSSRFLEVLTLETGSDFIKKTNVTE